MSSPLWQRHHVTVTGDGPVTLLFVHGLGTHQGVWDRMVAPFEGRYRVARMDLAGCGRAGRAAWDPARHASLAGHAQDLVAVADSLRDRRLVLVVHSVACMIGLLADLQAPQLVDAHVMVAPSPCYLNLPDYEGGLDPAQVDAILRDIDADVRAWSRSAAPMLLGGGWPQAYLDELQGAFDGADAQAFAQFAQVTFRGDYRQRLRELVKPVLVMQCAEDAVAPQSIGRYMQAQLPDCHLDVLPVAGHYPQLVAPQACVASLDRFLATLGFGVSEPASPG